MTTTPRNPTKNNASEGDEPRPVLDHLEELRRRLLWIAAAVAAASVMGYFAAVPALSRLADAVGPLVFTRPAEALFARMKVALALGVFFASPVALYQLWRFVGVALTVSERRVVLGALPFAYVLFAAGASFAWFVLVPAGLKVLVGFSTPSIQPFLSVESVFDFALWTTLGLGLLFQIPVAVSALAHWGVVSAAGLRAHRKHMFLGILVLSAVLTPGPDAFSQFMLAGPTYLLFELSVVLAAWLEPKKNGGA